MRLRNTILVALTVLATACGGDDDDNNSGGGGDNGGSRDVAACNLIGLQTKVIGGTTCTNTLQSSVVRLASVNAAGELTSIFCTGTMIAPATVLTATHCLEAVAKGSVVIAGDPGNVRAAAPVRISMAPGYSISNNRLFNDAALVFLDRDLGVPVMPVLLSRAAEKEETGYVYGYGRTVIGNGENPEQGIELQGGEMTVGDVTENHIFVAFNGGVNVCNGDSGGPLIISVNGQPAVAGVVSQGSEAGCDIGDVTTFTNLQSSTVLDWLTTNAPNILER